MARHIEPVCLAKRKAPQSELLNGYCFVANRDLPRLVERYAPFIIPQMALAGSLTFYKIVVSNASSFCVGAGRRMEEFNNDVGRKLKVAHSAVDIAPARHATALEHRSP